MNENIHSLARNLFNDFLEKNKLRKTAERYTVLDEIYSTNGHFDIETLFKKMKKKKVRISLATLYNNIELFLKCNLIIKHSYGSNSYFYERAIDSMAHDHLIDVENGTVMEFTDQRILDIIRDACAAHHFTPIRHSLYIYGRKDEAPL